MLPFVKGLFFQKGMSIELYFLSSFQLVDYSFFCICEVGDAVVLGLFRVGCKVSSSINDLWEGIFPGFRLISNRHWNYSLTLVSIGSLVMAHKERKQLLLWIVGHETFYFCRGQNVFNLPVLNYFPLSEKFSVGCTVTLVVLFLS